MAKYEWLANPDALKYVDTLPSKTQFIKMVILDSQDRPLKSIEGRSTGGSININGASAVRRTGSLTLVTDFSEKEKVNSELINQNLQSNQSLTLDNLNEVTNVKSLISMNKRCSIEIGIKNNGYSFNEFEIFWFPLGTYTITNANVSYNNSGITISVNLKDKMTLLNGELGGVIQTSIIHSPKEDEETKTTSPAKIKEIVKTLFQEFGEISPDNLMIEDIPDQIKVQARWIGETSLKLWKPTNNGVAFASINEPIVSTEFEGKEILPNQAYGYIFTDFTYPAEKEFSSNAGEAVTSALDKIKNTLGNFEYFYDLDGLVHFQEIKNYLNEGSAIDDLSAAINEKYFINTAGNKAVYSFNDAALITAYNNNPQYNLIKNDFTIWGKTSDSNQAIRYHLLVQDLPAAEEKCFWKKEDGKWTEGSQNDNIVDLSFEATKNKDNYNARIWRVKLYYMALAEENKPNHIQTAFEKEILENIPKVWHVEKDNNSSYDYGDLINDDRSQLYYWIDIINARDSSLMETVDAKQFSIQNIGRRPKVINDDNVNCLFSSRQGDITFYNAADYWNSSRKKPGSESAWIEAFRDKTKFKEVPENGYLVSPETLQSFSSESVENSAYERLRSVLHESLSWNNSISISTMPVYHLDVNQRISVSSAKADISGDYVINSISIPLALNGIMTINATKAVERI